MVVQQKTGDILAGVWPVLEGTGEKRRCRTSLRHAGIVRISLALLPIHFWSVVAELSPLHLMDDVLGQAMIFFNLLLIAFLVWPMCRESWRDKESHTMRLVTITVLSIIPIALMVLTRVRVSFDKDKRTLTISDNGVGMTRDEVIDHLGTIAKSGTKSFLESLGSDQAKDSQLIGQFGVGFYSAFIVADKVTVRTRAAGEKPENGVFWESAGDADITKEDRGTEITLHLREGEDEFLDDWRVRSIISKYSDHIALPVEIEKREEKDGETVISWEKINKAQALWTRNKSEITDEEYKEFYKHIAHPPFVIAENPQWWQQFLKDHVSILAMNEDEAEALTGESDP